MPQISIINNALSTQKKFDEILLMAKKEIVAIIPEKATALMCNKSNFQEWGKKGVKTRIMTHITKENKETAQELAKTCEVRQISAGYLGILVVDGEHLLQFKSKPENDKGKGNCESAFYTNDLTYVEGIKSLLEDLWKSAPTP